MKNPNDSCFMCRLCLLLDLEVKADEEASKELGSASLPETVKSVEEAEQPSSSVSLQRRNNILKKRIV